jgi:subtilisin family serine protease
VTLRRAASAIAGLALAGALATAWAAPAAPAGPSPAGDRAGAVPAGPVAWVVGLRASEPQRRLAASLEAAGASVQAVPRLRALAVSGGRRAEVVEAVDDADRVAYVEPLLSRSLHAEPASATDPATGRPFDWAFDAVRAQGGLAAAGGGAPASPVAVVDSGVDRGHPDLAGRVLEGRDVLGTGSVADGVGHGTFVAGLVSAIDGNGAGSHGVAGATPIVPVRVADGASVTSADLAAGIVAAVDLGARVVNVSIGGPGLSEVERSALDYARARDVVVVASAGNSALNGNPVEYPAAAVGGEAGGWSAGLSVGAVGPSGLPAPFSTHNRHVSIAAPGAGAGPCTEGVYSAIPTTTATLWSGGACDRVFAAPVHGPGRYAYGEGTSFSAPMVAGAAALVRQVRPGLRADQVGHVLRRSAVQTLGAGWNEHTGAGILDITGAVALAGRYDLAAPAISLAADGLPGAVRLRASAADVTAGQDELAGGVTLALELSRDGRGFQAVAPSGSAPVELTTVATPERPLWVRATACDANRNCATRPAGPLTGAAQATPPAAAPAARTRVRGAIAAFGVSGSCRAGRARCLHVAWRAGASGPRGVRYALEIRHQRTGTVLARARGAARTGRRHAITLVPRRPIACGRLVARLTLRSGRAERRLVRRAAVRRGCAPATAPRRRPARDRLDGR